MQVKICSKCRVEKQITEFRRDRTKVGGRAYTCKICMRALQCKRYKEKYAISRAQRDKALRDDNRAKITAHKVAVGCLKCPEKESICLEFHHLDPKKKDFGVSANTHRTWPYIEREIAKCVVVCSNCHRKIHAGLIVL